MITTIKQDAGLTAEREICQQLIGKLTGIRYFIFQKKCVK